MTLSTNEIIGRLRGMAMDTLQSETNRAFFSIAADRLNDVDARGRISADDARKFKGFVEDILSAANGFKE